MSYPVDKLLKDIMNAQRYCSDWTLAANLIFDRKHNPQIARELEAIYMKDKPRVLEYAAFLEQS